MIVSHSLRVIFISNPKTGSKSIDAALAQFQDEPSLSDFSSTGFYTKGHMPAYALRDILGRSVWDSYFKFSFVRNPWDWFVSQHFYNLQKHGILHHINEPLSLKDIWRTYHFLRRYRGAEWVTSACQHAFLCDEEGQVLVDFLGRFERLAADFSAVQSIIGTQTELQHVNPSVHHDYREYYADETRDLVHALYGRDIDIFSYDF